MRTILILLLMTSTSWANCQIAMSVSAPQATPPISVTKRWNDTDANCQTMGDALNAAQGSNVPGTPAPPTQAVAFGNWFQQNMDSLTQLTNRWIRATAPPPNTVDPVPQ